MGNTQTLVVGKHGEIRFPEELCVRYHLTPETPVRLVETRAGILIVPLAEAENSPDLEAELESWQQIAAESWGLFSYEDS
ncbi:MAG: hypothetical protein NZM28_07035 [Fimbriimonadales bacterium]|nr:hypothetical protein [Fimbriimonadales bacterium]